MEYIDWINQTDLAAMLGLTETTVYWYRKDEGLESTERMVNGLRLVCYDLIEVREFLCQKHPKYLPAFDAKTMFHTGMKRLVLRKNIDNEGETQETLAFDEAEEALALPSSIKMVDDRHSKTYFATCGCEIQVTTEVPIQVPILRMKPCKGTLVCKETFLPVMNATWDGWELADFNML